MKKGVSSGLPASIMSGKSILIISVIFISTLSFSLGYMVGKNGDRYSERELIKTRTEPLESSPGEAFDRTVEKIIRQDMEHPGNSGGPGNEEIVRPSHEQKPAGNEGPRYTIQIGAFKKSRDAERLKKILAKKGFESYIVTVSFSRGKLFKVRTGKYEEKAEADRRASKIRTIKGLDAIVLLEK